MVEQPKVTRRGYSAVEDTFILTKRNEGLSWTEIGNELERSKESVRARYRWIAKPREKRIGTDPDASALPFGSGFDGEG